MKVKLLKQIRKRFDIKLVYKTLSTNEYILFDKKTGKYYSSIRFFDFIMEIAECTGRFFELEGYLLKKRSKYNQRKLKRMFNK